LGLSRRAELMDKPLIYSTLADLLAAYVESYKQWWHAVLRIRIGLPVPHDVMYDGQVGESRLALKTYFCSLTQTFLGVCCCVPYHASLHTIWCQHAWMCVTDMRH